jgi:hypothetical protein
MIDFPLLVGLVCREALPAIISVMAGNHFLTLESDSLLSSLQEWSS